MSDFFTNDDAANMDVPEPPKPTASDLPDKAVVVVRTTNGDDKATVQPQVKRFSRKDNSGDFFIFKMPVVVVGGDKNIKPNHVGRYLFVDLNIEKPTAEQLEARIANAEAQGFESMANRLKGQLSALDKFPVSPELYNVILDTLAPFEGPAKDRFATARAEMAKVALGGPEAFGGSTELAYASAFCEVLKQGSRTLIGQTYTSKKEGARQTLGSIGTDTPEERKRRKVTATSGEEF